MRKKRILIAVMLSLFEIIQTHASDDALEKSSSQIVEEMGWFEGFTFQIDVFSILFSIVLMYITIRLVVNYYSDDSLANKISHKLMRKIPHDHARSSDLNNPEINALRNDIEQLKTEIELLNIKIENSKIPLEIVPPKYEQPSWLDTKQSEIRSPTETFFLSTPNSDGSFNESSVSFNFKEGASIYRFTKIQNNRAIFQIDEREASVKLALQYPDKNIDPVCDALNAFNPKAKRITTVEAGEAVFVNDKWKVNNTQKAKIRYEI